MKTTIWGKMLIPMIHVKMIQVISSDKVATKLGMLQTWEKKNSGDCSVHWKNRKKNVRLASSCFTRRAKDVNPGPALIFRCQKMCSVFLWAAQGCQSQKSPKAWAVLNHPEMIASSLGRYLPKNGFSIQGAATDQNRIDISLKRVT